MAINKSRDQYLDTYAAVVQVTTAALQNMPARDSTIGLAKAVFLVDPSGTPVYPSGDKAGTGTLSSVGASITAVTVLASNTLRLGGTVVNDSASVCYLGLSATTPTASLYTVALQPTGSVGAYYEIPSGYTGVVQGIWVSATGSARVTEFTA